MIIALNTLNILFYESHKIAARVETCTNHDKLVINFVIRTPCKYISIYRVAKYT